MGMEELEYGKKEKNGMELRGYRKRKRGKEIIKSGWKKL